MLPRHTMSGSRRKYYALKCKEAEDTKARSVLRIPAIDESSEGGGEYQAAGESIQAGPGNVDQVVEDGAQASASPDNPGMLTAASPARLNEFNAVNKIITHRGTQNGGEN
jgi:hypothetical protein